MYDRLDWLNSDGGSWGGTALSGPELPPCGLGCVGLSSIADILIPLVCREGGGGGGGGGGGAVLRDDKSRPLV